MVIAWGALGAAFLGPYIYGLFWKRTTKAGAYAGMFSGLFLSIITQRYGFFRLQQVSALKNLSAPLRITRNRVSGGFASILCVF